MNSEKVIYETGATTHAVNDLILFADNTRELAERLDGIYSRYRVHGRESAFRHSLDVFLLECAEQYRKEFPNPEDHQHINAISEEEGAEFKAFYFAGYTEWAKENAYTLENLRQLAHRAHSGTSFDPEKRAESIVKDCSEELDQDLESIEESGRRAYQENYIYRLSAWLSSRSGIYSTMIAGRSNFPTQRMEKKNRAEQNKYNDFRQWRERALKANAKHVEDAKPKSQKDSEEFAIIRKRILESSATIIGIDNGTILGSSRPLFVSNLANRINTLAKNGRTELVIKCLDLLKEVNSKVEKPVISANHSIWKLAQYAEAKREAQVDKANAESAEIAFDGGKIVLNHQADRLQILYDAKPGADIIAKLKKNAFRWSPSNMAWQRQLTNAAKYAAGQVTGVDYKTL